MTKAKETAPAFMGRGVPAAVFTAGTGHSGLSGLSGVMGKLGFQVFKSRQINREAYAQKLEAL